jgi:hypothetical protein
VDGQGIAIVEIVEPLSGVPGNVGLRILEGGLQELDLGDAPVGVILLR